MLSNETADSRGTQCPPNSNLRMRLGRPAAKPAVERGEGGATADPRLAREAELKRKQRERLIGKAAGSKKFGFSPRGTKKWGAQPDVGPTDVTV